MNQIRKISNLIFDIPRLILYSVYRLCFVIIHPIFSLMCRNRFGKGILYLIKDIANDDDFLFIIPLLIIFNVILCTLWVLYHVIFPLTVCVTIGAVILHVAIIPTIILLIFGFFANEWLKTYGNEDGGIVKEEPKSSMSLAGIEKLKPEEKTVGHGTTVKSNNFERSCRTISNNYSISSDGTLWAWGANQYIPEARFIRKNDVPDEGFSAKQVVLPDGPWGEGGIYTEYYNNGELIQRVKKYEI